MLPGSSQRTREATNAFLPPSVTLKKHCLFLSITIVLHFLRSETSLHSVFLPLMYYLEFSFCPLIFFNQDRAFATFICFPVGNGMGIQS